MLLQLALCLIHNQELSELGMNIIIIWLKSIVLYFSSTGNDEMCNFYMMYWVDGDELLHEDVCSSPGPPNYYFGYDTVCIFLLDI